MLDEPRGPRKGRRRSSCNSPASSPKGPAGFLELAGRVIADRERIYAGITADPAGIGFCDQLQAASGEAALLLQATAGVLGTEAQPAALDERSLAWALAVTAAVYRRCWSARCRHVRARLASPGPLLAALSERRIACYECAPRWQPLTIDDGVCDVCDAPCCSFTELMASLPSGLLVSGNVCDACAGWVAGLPLAA